MLLLASSRFVQFWNVAHGSVYGLDFGPGHLLFSEYAVASAISAEMLRCASHVVADSSVVLNPLMA